LTEDADGRKRISSGAFSPSSDPPGSMSVDLERPMFEAGVEPLSRLPGPDWGAVAFVVGSLRGMDLRVGSDPLPENPFHGGVWGTKRGRVRKGLLKLFVLLNEPAGMN